MKIRFKISAIVFFIIIFLASYIYAVDTLLTAPSTINSTNSGNEVLSTSNGRNEESDNEILISDSNDEEFVNSSNTSDELVEMQTPIVTTSSNSSADKLSSSDIINIVLIAVCIVLIFLAVAILIRLK